METSNFGKTSLSCQYDETSHNDPSKTNGWSFIGFLYQLLLSQDALGKFFSSYLILSIIVTFMEHQIQQKLTQTQGLLVYLS